MEHGGTTKAHSHSINGRRETDSQAVIHQLEKWSAIMAFFGICAIASLFLLSLYPKKAGAVFEKLLFIFPHHLRDKLVNLLHSFISGLMVFDHKTKLIWIGVLSLIIWLLNAASVYVLCYSFDIGLSFAGACFVIVCLALAVALPQAPGFHRGFSHRYTEIFRCVWYRFIICSEFCNITVGDKCITCYCSRTIVSLERGDKFRRNISL